VRKAGDFIGTHLANKLKRWNYFVIGVALKFPEYNVADANVVAPCAQEINRTFRSYWILRFLKSISLHYPGQPSNLPLEGF
jgi:hypothetical protein